MCHTIDFHEIYQVVGNAYDFRGIFVDISKVFYKV